MEQSVVEMAKDIVSAQIQAGQLTPDDMQQALAAIHTKLMILKAKEDLGEVSEVLVPRRPSGAIDWRKSITQHVITCLECGAIYKQLSIRHLRGHDLTARLYRLKYGIPKTQPLAARATTARRRQVVQEIRPWEKTPRYLQTQAENAARSKKTRTGQRGQKTKAR